MRLRGSKTEQEFRDILIKSHNALFEEDRNKGLLHVLKTYFPLMKTAYFIDHIPEQGEDLYTILINLDTIAKVEINRDRTQEPIVEIIKINDFMKGLSRINQINIAVALDLAKKDII